MKIFWKSLWYKWLGLLYLQLEKYYETSKVKIYKKKKFLDESWLGWYLRIRFAKLCCNFKFSVSIKIWFLFTLYLSAFEIYIEMPSSLIILSWGETPNQRKRVNSIQEWLRDIRWSLINYDLRLWRFYVASFDESISQTKHKAKLCRYSNLRSDHLFFNYSPSQIRLIIVIQQVFKINTTISSMYFNWK